MCVFVCSIVISPRLGYSNRRYLLQLSLLQHFTSKYGLTLFSSHSMGFDAGKSRSASMHLYICFSIEFGRKCISCLRPFVSFVIFVVVVVVRIEYGKE